MTDAPDRAGAVLIERAGSSVSIQCDFADEYAAIAFYDTARQTAAAGRLEIQIATLAPSSPPARRPGDRPLWPKHIASRALPPFDLDRFDYQITTARIGESTKPPDETGRWEDVDSSEISGMTLTLWRRPTHWSR